MLTALFFSPRNKRKFSCDAPAVKLMPDLSEFMTVQDTAEKLGFNVQSIRHMVRTGTLKGKKIGRMVFVYKTAVHEYIEKTKDMSKHDPRRRQIISN
jgi:excisionase family DNA binding protein